MRILGTKMTKAIKLNLAVARIANRTAWQPAFGGEVGTFILEEHCVCRKLA